MKYYSTNLYKDQNRPQPRRCFAILRRTVRYHEWQSDFRGSLVLEDRRHYTVAVSVGMDRDGNDVLRIYLDPRHLRKTPVTPSLCQEVQR